MNAQLREFWLVDPKLRSDVQKGIPPPQIVIENVIFYGTRRQFSKVKLILE